MQYSVPLMDRNIRTVWIQYSYTNGPGISCGVRVQLLLTAIIYQVLVMLTAVLYQVNTSAVTAHITWPYRSGIGQSGDR